MKHCEDYPQNGLKRNRLKLGSGSEIGRTVRRLKTNCSEEPNARKLINEHHRKGYIGKVLRTMSLKSSTLYGDAQNICSGMSL